ncbi:MAG: hypothetical protein H6817_03245 [Phycisphaerales bacterium]|nr:hypothetical protein [Phycisphaerales bacterium]
MIIDETNYEIANSAVRDILFMYRDMAETYAGFGGTIDTGTFDPFDFLEVEVVEKEGYSLDIDARLLRNGASVAIVCSLHDALCKEPAVWSLRDQTIQVRDAGLFDFDDALRAVIDAGLAPTEEFFGGLATVYERLVRPYLKYLAER